MKLGESMTDEPLFYIILIGLIIIVYAQIAYKNSKSAPKQQSLALEEFEQTVELFASDLEEQNEALVQLFQDTKRDYELHLAKQAGKIELLEKQSLEMAQEITQLKLVINEIQLASHVKVSEQAEKHHLSSEMHIAHVETIHTNTAAMEIAAGQAMNEQEIQTVPSEIEIELVSVQQAVTLPTVKDRYPEIFSLYDSGKSIEYIAKKLGKNKGEVSLILMLSKQEEAAG